MTTTDQYLAALRPEHAQWAAKVLEVWDSEGGLILPPGASGAVSDAIVGDLWSIHTRATSKGLYVAHLAKQTQAQERRARTVAMTKRIHGPGLDQRGRPKDMQRSKVYAAERATVQYLDNQRTFDTVAEMQAYTDKLLASAWWRRRYPRCTAVEIRSGGGHRRAVSYGGVVHMPKWARIEAVLLHELAHEVHWADRSTNVAVHGREYCQVYLELVRHRMGDDAWRMLKAEYRSRKVKFTRPRQMSDEAKAAAGARLKAARKR